MARVFFGHLILLNFILYSKYESRLKGRHGGCIHALLRRLIFKYEVRVQSHLLVPTTRQPAGGSIHIHDLRLLSAGQISRPYAEAHAQTLGEMARHAALSWRKGSVLLHMAVKSCWKFLPQRSPAVDQQASNCTPHCTQNMRTRGRTLHFLRTTVG